MFRPLLTPTAPGMPPDLWHPSKWFENGEPGLVIDPLESASILRVSSVSSGSPALYPAVIGQAVAAVLDCRFRLARGAERVVNGSFSANLDGWSAGSGGWSWAAGEAVLNGDGSIQTLRQAGVFEIGKFYEISADVRSTGGRIGFENGSAQTFLVNTTAGLPTERISCVWRADRTDISIKRVSGTVTAYFDNISVKEIPGNHLYQMGESSQPTYDAVTDLPALYFPTGTIWLQSVLPLPFAGVQKMSVIAGVQPQGVVNTDTIIELGSSVSVVPGTFLLRTRASSGANYPNFFINNGALVTASAAGTSIGGLRTVLTGQGDLSDATASIRKNGALIESVTSGAGSTTQFADGQTLYVGARAGSSVPYGGWLRALILRGAPTADITPGERWVNRRTGNVG